MKGQVTGTRVKVLDDTEHNSSGFKWLVTTLYYDDRYRPIQSLRNLYSTTTTDNEIVSTQYDFTGKVLKTKTKQVFRGNTNTVTETNTYDHAGRLKQVKHQLNSGTEVTLASMEYNELGQLKKKTLHGSLGSGVQDLNYAYNIRGWLASVNTPGTNPPSGSKTLFNMGLYYNSVPSGITANALYNGNISAMVWNTPAQSGAQSPATIQGYGFTYDGLNRLKTSSYGEGSSFASYAGANNENYAYDLNGNLTSLTRYLRGTGQIDLLTYTYKNSGASNQLDRVDDTATYPTIGFYNGVSTTGEYGYDANGNLTSDLNKGYNSIAYNYLNLPKKVGTTSQYIRYIYSADGTKLAKVGTGGVYTYYPGRFVYSESSLTMILTSEGKVLPGGSYQYFLKDHLGNTRMVVSSTGSIVQQTDYYPFGLEIASYTGGTENKYLYNGKEKQDDIINSRKLDWYDYGARFYDPTIGRWHSIDPSADEQGQEVTSPYCYVLNNPVRNTDPDGKVALIDNLIGAAFGAVVEYGGQVAANYLEKGLSKSIFTDNIDLGDIGIAAGEGFLTSGGSTVVKAVATIGGEVTRNLIDYKTSSDGSGKVNFKVNDAATTTKNTAIGLTLGKIGEAAPAIMKVTARTAPTVNQAVKIARTEAKASGTIVDREMRTAIVSKTKKAQVVAKETNVTISKSLQNTLSGGASEYIKRKTDQQ